MQSIPILYRDKGVVFVNKPVGLAMHDEAAMHDETARNKAPDSVLSNSQGIVTRLKEQLNVPHLHLCHRLDTGTSGCLCLAENESVAAEIGRLFETRQVSKYYLALSDKKPKKKQGAIIGDMKNRRGGQHILLKTTVNPALTQFFSYSAKPGVRGFILKPHSGKTHQIRVALKSIGAPILGDVLYGGSNADRLYLHAFKLTLPLKSGVISATAPLLEGDIFNEAQVKDWISSIATPEVLLWPALPSRFQQECDERGMNIQGG